MKIIVITNTSDDKDTIILENAFSQKQVLL